MIKICQVSCRESCLWRRYDLQNIWLLWFLLLPAPFSVIQSLNHRRKCVQLYVLQPLPLVCRPARTQGDCPQPNCIVSLGLSRSQGAQQSWQMESAPGLRVQLDLWCLRSNFLLWDFDTCHSDFCRKLTVFPGIYSAILFLVCAQMARPSHDKLGSVQCV